jgi:hypothetical protein
VKRQGFAKSPYPIILSLENHCSLGSQDRIAHLLETILGDMIEKPSNGKMSELPSPEKVTLEKKKVLSASDFCRCCGQLKNKVLIKAKSHATSAIESDLTLQEDGEEIPEFKKTDLPAPEEQGKSKISERLAK